MGEIADDHIAYMVERGYKSSIPTFRPRNAYGPLVSCRHCGSRAVYWQRDRGNYVLWDKNTLQRHTCLTTKDMTTEGFDDVD